jgi:hypothetical protein
MAVKVKQSTIDEIKKMGMTKALAAAKTRRGAEYQEAIRRMYGQRRLDAAMKGAQGGSMPRATYMYKGTSPGASGARRKQIGRNTPGSPAGTGNRQGSSKNRNQIRNRAIAVGAAYAGGGAAYAAKKLMDQRKKNSTKAITSGKPKLAITAGKQSPKAPSGSTLTPSRAKAMAGAVMNAKEKARKAELAKRGAGSSRRTKPKGTQTPQQKRAATVKKVARVTKASVKQTLKPSKAGGKVLGPIGIGVMAKEQAKAASSVFGPIAKGIVKQTKKKKPKGSK